MICSFKAVLQPFRMGVGNEYLAVGGTGHQGDQAGDAFLVQFFKHIVQQQQRRKLFELFDHFKLGQLQGKQRALALSLRGAAFHGMVVEQELEVIAVDAGGGPLQLEIFKAGRPQLGRIIFFLQRALIADIHHLVGAGDIIVQLLHLRNEISEKGFALFEDGDAVADQLFVKHVQQAVLFLAGAGDIFQQCVALHQYFLIGDQMLEIVGVQLGEEGVQPFAAFFAAAKDDFGIVGGDDHRRKLPDMPGEAVVLLVVEGHFLFPVFNGADNFSRLSLFLEIAFQPEAVGLVLGVLAFVAGKVTAGEAEVVDGVQQVGFAGAVSAGDAYHPLVEPKVLPGIIFKLGERYFPDM